MTQASAVRTRCPAGLVTAIRSATDRHADWQQTAVLVADQVRLHLPGPGILTAEERQGSRDGYVCHTLHTEPDGGFSVCAVVWRPGQQTPIHDHVAWCVVGVLEGAESEELFALRDHETALEQVGRRVSMPGEVGGFAPPGDIHRVTNHGSGVAISLHVYGADIARLGSSVRRTYDLPVLARSPVSPARYKIRLMGTSVRRIG
jgi:predicted metal-dependent enzyme (double-stranded beta helix superfamily)